ncbi:O-methyltransferase [Pseudoxanthomonas koreensis]|uniref:O-methyltransferase n=1 Tax=Pseudoxanthomonas koreensis TaxID=266061 RepID=UPI0035A5DF64
MNDSNNIREPEVITSIWHATREVGFSMASEPLTCSFLRTLAASKPGSKFLELGSGTGLSTAWLLDGMNATATLTTVDNDEVALSVLRHHLGNDNRLTVVCSDGDEFIKGIAGQRFDFIFADTWSGKYQMLDETLALLNPGGLYVIDDMLPQSNWPDGHAEKVSALTEKLESLPMFVTSKLSWASGLIVATKCA